MTRRRPRRSRAIPELTTFLAVSVVNLAVLLLLYRRLASSPGPKGIQPRDGSPSSTPEAERSAEMSAVSDALEILAIVLIAEAGAALLAALGVSHRVDRIASLLPRTGYEQAGFVATLVTLTAFVRNLLEEN